MNHWDLYVFDFDGTLVDSNPIKRRAFEACFSEFQAQREEIMAYCRGYNDVTRSEKFRTVYEQMLKIPYTPEVERRLHRRFEEETTEAIVRAPEVPGATRFLEQVRCKHRTALLSATPHSILLEILERRGWSKYFDLKRGAPVDKSVWLKEQQATGLNADQIVFFGDSPEDALAARRTGCRFMGVGSASLLNGETVVPDFRPLLLS